MKAFSSAITLFFMIWLSLTLAGCGDTQTLYSAYSDNDEYAENAAELNPPEDLVAVPGNSSVVLSWNALDGAEYYNVHWSFTGEAGDTAGTISTSETSFLHMIQGNPEAIYYTVTAVNQSGESSPSLTFEVSLAQAGPPANAGPQGSGPGSGGNQNPPAADHPQGPGSGWTSIGNSITAGGSNTIPANPADPGVRPAIPALPDQANGNPGGGKDKKDEPPAEPPVELCPDGSYAPCETVPELCPDGSYAPCETVPELCPDGSYAPCETVPELCPDGSYAPCQPVASNIIVRTKSGLMLVDKTTGQVRTFNASLTGSIEVRQGRIYALNGRNIVELNTSGQTVRSITAPAEARYFINFTALPGGGFALLDNQNDKIYFIDDTGGMLATVDIKAYRDSHWQNVHGVVVGDTFILSEDGDRRLLAVSLEDYSSTVFRDFSASLSGWLNVITYHNGLYYLTTPGSIYTFTEDGPLSLLTNLNDYNITGLLIPGDGYAYVTVNFTGHLYRFDLATGEHELIVTGLNYPQDLAAF